MAGVTDAKEKVYRAATSGSIDVNSDTQILDF